MLDISFARTMSDSKTDGGTAAGGICAGIGGSIQAREAILNEILELRNVGLLESSEKAYALLKDVEGEVLPTWQEHGRKVLRDNGVGLERLRVMGMPVERIEMLYQALYAFAFGFCSVVKSAIQKCTDPGAVMISVSKVYALLLSEALETTFSNLLQMKLDEKEAENHELLRQVLIHKKKMDSMVVEARTLREDKAVAEKNLSQTEQQCAEQVRAAMKAKDEAEQQLSQATELLVRSGKQYDESVQEAERLRKRTLYAEEELQSVTGLYEAELANVEAWRKKLEQSQDETLGAEQRLQQSEDMVRTQRDRIRDLERQITASKHATAAEHEKYKKVAQDLVVMISRRDEAVAARDVMQRDLREGLQDAENKRKMQVESLQSKVCSIE